MEILESYAIEQKREIELHKNENASKSKIIEDLKIQNAALEQKKDRESMQHDDFANATEQYSRRNNLRITGVPKDQDRKSSESVTNKFITLVNTHLGMSIVPNDIDIAHRLG
ncbi:hypothetical protein DPMN_094004 [Dreissena polymorpha]|uniref:Uncharacterized protein n=1 Tax=Dreissena polymorpha TaxID=45954 RepID=A0A9D4R2G3_DREPO|nr:hypothetical protein DPMN_094004 [Dreissena polymorpha]